MRLMKDDGQGNLSLEQYQHPKIPQYAILSHTWGAEEVTFEDVIEGTGKNKVGYEKIEFCRKQSLRDGISYFWVDTCCIKKSSDAELTEAINSMFRWYQNADRCYVYLSDVAISGNATDHQNTWEAAFRDSRWFCRGWTLQELIAPTIVEFFSLEGKYLGNKVTLEQQIHSITGIAIRALRGHSLKDFEVEERFLWAKYRDTKRPEDKAYSLLGIFSINMSLRYGEGSKEAFMRLRRKIRKSMSPAAEQIDFSPRPSSMVPFRADVDFVDRKTCHDGSTLLEQIDQRCSTPAARVALVGIGGAGKSQLAIEYCYRLRKRSPNTWVFWIHASNIDRIEQGYREIAERVNLPGRSDPKKNIFELVAGWLGDETKGRWVVVLDNLDDDAVFSTPQAASRMQSGDHDVPLRRPLPAYLPQSQNGIILITTRTRSVATKLVEPRDIIPVDSMTDTDALELLQQKLGGIRDKHDLKELARILEHMPLAIVQAAAYIQEKGARYSVRQYIEAFQRNEKQKTNLLDYEAGQLRRDPEAKNSIIITWQISFDEIRQRWPAAADLLSLMSYFDRQGIPEEVLMVQLREEEIQDSTNQNQDDVANNLKDEDQDTKDDGASELDSNNLFEEAVERLRSYSFVSIGLDGWTFEMHALVQLAMRKWLEMHREAERWKAQYSRKLNAVFPNGDHKNWTRCESFFPHAKSAEKQRPMENRSVREWAQILRKAGWYAWAKGDYVEAERMCELSVRVLKKLLGEDDVETSYSLGLLSSIYRNQGRWTEAETIGVQVIETKKIVLGDEHPETLTSMDNLATTYSNQGRWTEAETIEVQVMETMKRVLGDEHPDTLTSIANLATTYRNQGRLTEAETMGVQVIETMKRVLGDEHPDTLTSMDNLATTYWNQGRWTEAETIEVQVMETKKRVLGDEHPDTLTSIANLATTYQNQGRWTEAETMGVQVMETMKRVLGDEHPNTLTIMNNLAFTMKELGRIMEATKLMAECVQLRNQVLGSGHPQALSYAAALAEWQMSND